MAILIDSQNFANATWTPFQSSIPINLPTSEGPHQVWVGVKGLDGDTIWTMNKITVDLTPPAIHFTSPTQPTSNIQHPTSNLEHRTSNLEHRTSNLEHRTSNFPGE